MPRRVFVTGLVVLATVFSFVSLMALWANRQFLNTNGWTRTSSELLERKAVRVQVAEFLVDRLYARVDVQGRLAQVLPPVAKPLAGPAAGALRNAAEKGVEHLLQRPRVQLAWEKANRVAHQELLAAIEGESSKVSTSDGNVTLHLSAMLATVASSLGFGNLGAKIPPDAADITVLRSNKLDTVKSALKALRGAAVVLLILSAALFAAAVALSRRRRESLRAVGVGLVVAGVLALLTRLFAGHAIINALASTAAVKPAITDTWTVATSLLVEAALSTIAYGVVIVLAAWLVGPTRVASAARRRLAPFIEDPRWAFGGLGVLVVLLVVWGPTPATRQPLGVLVFAALLAVGVELLRRQTAREYPDATLGELGQAGQAGMARVGSAVSAGGRAVAGRVGGLRSGGAPSPAGGDKLDQLERLERLRESGALDEAEFQAEKRRVLGGEG
jgi:hypothetical protein